MFTTTYRYALNPTRENALFKRSESHSPKPAMVPKSGPKALSMYTYVPPDLGIAVPSSDFESTAGRIQIAATRKANHTEEPVISTAYPGKTNIPLNIPPILTAIAPGNDSVLSNFFKILFYI